MDRKPTIYGYARVSTKGQNAARQIDALLPYVHDPENIIVDRQSGKDFQRPGYQALKQTMHPGDILIVPSLDRLGRNYDQIRVEWAELYNMGILVKVLDFPLLDTTVQRDDLMRKFLADVVFVVLSFVANNELVTTRERQREGINAAKQRGQKFGRKVVRPPEFDEAYKKMKAGELTPTEAWKASGMAQSTFYKRCREIAEGKIPPP